MKTQWPRKILPWGEVPNNAGKKLVVGKELVEAFASPLYAWRRVALDYQHNTCPGTAEYARTAEPRRVAGFGPLEIREGDGVYLSVDHWVDSEEDALKNYEDLSAVPVPDADGNIIAILSVGLCRNGSVPGATLAPAWALDAVSSLIHSNPETTTTKDTTMDAKKLLLKILKLKDDATDADIEAAADAAAAPAKTEAPAPAPAATPLSAADVAELKASIAELRADALLAKKQTALAAARAEGKAIPLSAEDLGKFDLAALNALIAKTPKTVPLAAHTPGYVAESSAGGDAPKYKTLGSSAERIKAIEAGN